jgi:hypothetical protein
VGRFLTTDVEDAFFGHLEYGLKRKCGFANTRLTAQEYNATWHKSATEDTIQFPVMHVDARIVVVGDVSET